MFGIDWIQVFFMMLVGIVALFFILLLIGLVGRLFDNARRIKEEREYNKSMDKLWEDIRRSIEK